MDSPSSQILCACEKSIKEKNNSLINENERIIRIESPCFYGGKYKILLGFAHREVARNHEKSVIFDLFSLDKKSRKSPI